MVKFDRNKVLKSDRKYDGGTVAKPKTVTDAIYDDVYTGRTSPKGMKAKDESLPQFKEDRMTARDAQNTSGWVKAEGNDATKNRPGGFSRSHNPDNPAKGGKCKATGDNMEKSPFSAAHKTWQD